MTNEILEKLKAAKSAEELIEMAKANGAEITAEDAQKLFSQNDNTGKKANIKKTKAIFSAFLKFIKHSSAKKYRLSLYHFIQKFKLPRTD